MRSALQFVALVLLTSAAVTSAQELSDADYHPTDAQVMQMQQSCGLNDTGMLTLERKVGTVVADWNKATAGAGPAAALRQLGEFFDQLRNEGGLSGRKEIYVLCVEKALRAFVDLQRERPQAVEGSGTSEPLQRSAFASEEEIWRRGCQRAQSDASSKLEAQCGERTFVVTGSDCAQRSGNVRTYTAQVQGECRGK